MTTTDLLDSLTHLASAAKQASHGLAAIGSAQKDAALLAAADALERDTERILAANAEDTNAARENGISGAFLDRLTLTPARVRQMAHALREIAGQPDPVGEIRELKRRPSGLRVGRMRIPLGVVLIIYEARPNVTTDAAALCLKSGNAVILRGGSDALHSNRALAEIMRTAVAETGIDPAAIQLVDTADRAASKALLRMPEHIDLAIPRGGKGLIRFVTENARVPVVFHADGVCHVVIDQHADDAKAVAIAENAKVQRPGVCNAMETLLVHTAIAERVLPPIAERLAGHGVSLRGCAQSVPLLRKGVAAHAASVGKPPLEVASVESATEEDWSAEYLDLVLAVRIVSGLDEAIAHIQRYGSGHTESIVTESYAEAERFLTRVNSSCVMVNASTRFNDGGQLGLGAEIGISTCKLHAYGPMGARELTAEKFVVYGHDHIRD